MKYTKKKQIDKMINEGLGSGQINNERDKKKLQSPLSKDEANQREDKHNKK